MLVKIVVCLCLPQGNNDMLGSKKIAASTASKNRCEQRFDAIHRACALYFDNKANKVLLPRQCET
jgi:hypothetical protein